MNLNLPIKFIPLSYYKNSNYACFFSANSAQKITQTDNLMLCQSKGQFELPYIFMISRIAHYLKIREKISVPLKVRQCWGGLNKWIKPGLKCRIQARSLLQHPLKAAEVSVNELTDNQDFSVSIISYTTFSDRRN